VAPGRPHVRAEWRTHPFTNALSRAGVLYGPPSSKVGSSRDKISVGDLVRLEYDG